MIYTVTLNPSIDYVIELDSLNHGSVNRVNEENIYPGGKGINVSNILNELGYKNIALGFISGFTGKYIVDSMIAKNLNCDFIELSNGFTRINVKIKSNEETEVNGNGPNISEEDLQKLYDKIDNLNPFNGATKLTYAVYYLLRLSYELGYERIIIMEDDIKFLKDKKELNNLLKYIFNNAPENFDIIVGNMELLTDYYYNFSDDFLENKYFRHNNIDADTVYYSCSTINIYSRSGMKKLINFFEHIYCAIDRYNLFMLNIPDINLYSIYPWLGVQERYGIEFKNFPQIKNLYNLNDIVHIKL